MIVDFTLANLIIIALGGVFSMAVLVLSEILNQRGIIHDEIARKSSHFGIGLILFIWLSIWGHEVYLTLLILAVLATLALWPLGIFKSIHDVKRRTIGHLLYPIGLIVPAVFFDDIATNQVALLHLFTVDTAAALVGKYTESPIIIRMGGSQKTVFGSLAFVVCSTLVFSWFVGFSSSASLINAVVFTSAAAGFMTMSEMLGFYGLDNLYLPLLAAILFSMIT